MGLRDIVVATRSENDRLQATVKRQGLELHQERKRNRDLTELLTCVLACPSGSLCASCQEAVRLTLDLRQVVHG